MNCPSVVKEKFQLQAEIPYGARVKCILHNSRVVCREVPNSILQELFLALDPPAEKSSGNLPCNADDLSRTSSHQSTQLHLHEERILDRERAQLNPLRSSEADLDIIDHARTVEAAEAVQAEVVCRRLLDDESTGACPMCKRS